MQPPIQTDTTTTGPTYRMVGAADLPVLDRHVVVQEIVERYRKSIEEQIQDANLRLQNKIVFRVIDDDPDMPRTEHMNVVINGTLIEILKKAGYRVKWLYDSAIFTIVIGWPLLFKREIIDHYHKILEETKSEPKMRKQQQPIGPPITKRQDHNMEIAGTAFGVTQRVL